MEQQINVDDLDPYSYNLTSEQKHAIVERCKVDPDYYLTKVLSPTISTAPIPPSLVPGGLIDTRYAVTTNDGVFSEDQHMWNNGWERSSNNNGIPGHTPGHYYSRRNGYNPGRPQAVITKIFEDGKEFTVTELFRPQPKRDQHQRNLLDYYNYLINKE